MSFDDLKDLDLKIVIWALAGCVCPISFTFWPITHLKRPLTSGLVPFIFASNIAQGIGGRVELATQKFFRTGHSRRWIENPEVQARLSHAIGDRLWDWPLRCV